MTELTPNEQAAFERGFVQGAEAMRQAMLSHFSGLEISGYINDNIRALPAPDIQQVSS